MAYFSFGAGPRQCIGNTMALLELRTIVTMINQRFKLSMIPGHALRYGSPVISLRPLEDVMVRLTSRDRPVPGSRTATPVTHDTTDSDAHADTAEDVPSTPAEGCPVHRRPDAETR